MLTKLYIDGFRLWADTTITFRSGVPTVLIGPNGSGKTTILEVLSFLSVAASDGLRSAVYDVRGGPSEFFRAGSNELHIEIWIGSKPGRLSFDQDHRVPLHYQLSLGRAGAFVQVNKETISTYPAGFDHDRVLFLDRDRVSSKILNATTEEWDEIPSGDDERLVFESIRQDRNYPVLRIVRESLSRLRVYSGFSTQPRWTLDPREREMSPRNAVVVQPQYSLDPTGRGLVNALYTLQQHDEQKWSYLLRQMKAEFPFCERIVFPPDPGGAKLALAWQDSRFPGLLSAEQMSEGMWSFLLLLAALLPKDPAELVAFDEPDTHLHPSALRRLVGLLEEASSESTVVFTSHSSRVLDELDEPSKSVVICEPTDGGAAIREMDQDRTQAWLKEYDGFGELREHGLLDPENRR